MLPSSTLFTADPLPLDQISSSVGLCQIFPIFFQICEGGISQLPSHATKDLTVCKLNSKRGFITLAPGTIIKYAWVGVPPASCPCYPQKTSPNGNAFIDGAVSVIGHELAEAATNPSSINVIKNLIIRYCELK